MSNAVLTPEKAQSGGSRERASKSKSAQKKTKGKNQELGRKGEEMACHYLGEKGIIVLERNWVCKSGEADIIAREEDTLVFIEVKTRSEGSVSLPEEAVTRQKRIRYEKIAISYLMRHQHPSGPIRFDVIAIKLLKNMRCVVRHHRGAFSVGD